MNLIYYIVSRWSSEIARFCFCAMDHVFYVCYIPSFVVFGKLWFPHAWGKSLLGEQQRYFKSLIINSNFKLIPAAMSPGEQVVIRAMYTRRVFSFEKCFFMSLLTGKRQSWSDICALTYSCDRKWQKSNCSSSDRQAGPCFNHVMGTVIFLFTSKMKRYRGLRESTWQLWNHLFDVPENITVKLWDRLSLPVTIREGMWYSLKVFHMNTFCCFRQQGRLERDGFGLTTGLLHFAP